MPSPLDGFKRDVVFPRKSIWDIPKNKNYPPDAVQCDDCGGWGCTTCRDRGWLPRGDPKGRVCERVGCNNPIPPSQIAVYCTDECARQDA